MRSRWPDRANLAIALGGSSSKFPSKHSPARGIFTSNMLAPVSRRIACIQRLSLLSRWLALSEEYSRVVLARVTAKSRRDREFLNAVIDDILTQIEDVRRQLELHRVAHGC